MYKFNNRKEVEEYLRGLKLTEPEDHIRKVVVSLRSDPKKYHLYNNGIDRKTGVQRMPICSKGTIDKIKRLLDEGKLDPYIDYISQASDGSTSLNKIVEDSKEKVQLSAEQSSKETNQFGIIKELKTFIVTIGNQQLDAATILQKIWMELGAGKIDYEIAGIIGKEFGVVNAGSELFMGSNSILQYLNLHRIVRSEQRLMPNGPRPSFNQTHWILTDYGKEIVLMLNKTKR
jgi:hypothetical protein